MRRLAVAIASSLIAMAPASAHETWILAGPAHVERAAPLTLAITSGMDFPRLESGLSRSVLSRSGVRLGERTTPLAPLAELPQTLVARAETKSPGIATIWLALPPEAITLTPVEVDAYFDEINADAAVRDAWAADPRRQWHERFAKFAKKIVRIGPIEPADRSWSVPVGGDLEIIPESDPTVPGASLAIRLLEHGVPLAGQMLAATDGGRRDWRRTDADGRATFPLTGDGPWLIHGTVLRRAVDGDGWESRFTTLTVGMRAPRAVTDRGV